MPRYSPSRRGRTAFLLVLLSAVVLAVSSAAPAAAPAEAAPAEAPLEVILERAGAYALRYGDSFRNLAAEEAYRQVVAGQVRNMRSDVVFVQISGPIPWYTFRDVYMVDGSQVRDRTGRLERLFANSSPSQDAQARAILAESTRYNLGAVKRNVNAPAVALLFLLPENQARLDFERKAGKTIAGFPTLEVAFHERTRPTLVRDARGADVPASGSFWIDPSRGTVLRTQIEYHVGGDSTRGEAPVTAVVLTKYRRETGLDVFVPDTMKESYRTHGGGVIEGQARYLKYRRFQVTSDWEVTGTGPAPGTGTADR